MALKLCDRCLEPQALWVELRIPGTDSRATQALCSDCYPLMAERLGRVDVDGSVQRLVCVGPDERSDRLNPADHRRS